ncbi:hypothetical protein ZWY2020_003607 [Hordeum vulgare]|nr:hypothetical protein ZWY2020_003607 [Hordeum vulgare]
MALRQEGDETGKAQANRGATAGHLTRGMEDVLWWGSAALGCSSEPRPASSCWCSRTSPSEAPAARLGRPRSTLLLPWAMERRRARSMEELRLARRVYGDRSCGGIEAVALRSREDGACGRAGWGN